jgi:hypothetical protein
MMMHGLANPKRSFVCMFCQVVILEHKSIICAGYSAVMHIHCAAEEVTVKVSIVPTAGIVMVFLYPLRKSTHDLQKSSFLSITLFRIFIIITVQAEVLNPLNPKLNPICYFLALLGAHHFLHVSRIRVKL